MFGGCQQKNGAEPLDGSGALVEPTPRIKRTLKWIRLGEDCQKVDSKKDGEYGLGQSDAADGEIDALKPDGIGGGQATLKRGVGKFVAALGAGAGDVVGAEVVAAAGTEGIEQELIGGVGSWVDLVAHQSVR